MSSLYDSEKKLKLELPSLSRLELTSPRAVNGAALRLESVLLQRSAQHSEAPVDVTSETVAALHALYERYETNLEKKYAERVIDRDAQVETYPLYERFGGLTAKEIAAAEIQKTDNVLFIGSGPFPVSPILLHQQSGGARIHCFDSSQEACDTSRRLVARLGLQRAITIDRKAGQDARLPSASAPGEMSEYDVVVVALLAQPKQKVLDRIQKTASSDTRVVLRTSEGNRRLLYAGAEDICISGFKEIGAYHAGANETISGVVLQRAA
ncbi:hypothetical protein CSA80_03500 [Candidatus Saccharibacteria bacterium]|nr:MAG: hypothetical protein CSA80_03500 [Candidatus Saccharibacteria bacterium]